MFAAFFITNHLEYSCLQLIMVISFYHLGDLRAKGKSISRAITSILLLIFLKLYSPLKNAITEYGLFYLFAGVMALLTPLIYFKGPRRADDKPSNWFYMPETKDVPLEDIRYLFTLSVRRRNDDDDTTRLIPRDERTATERYISFGTFQNTIDAEVEERNNQN